MSAATIHIDQWEILLTTTILLSEGQVGKIIMNPEDPLIVNIRFENSSPAEGEVTKASVSVSGKGNEGWLILKDWNSPLDSATAKPLEFAVEDNGDQIAVMCTARKIGKNHQAFLQFMRKASK